MRHISVIAIIALAACDFVANDQVDSETLVYLSTGTGEPQTTTDNPMTTGASDMPVDTWCGQVGGLFGPCIDGADCMAPFFCHHTDAGSICAATSDFAAEHVTSVSQCGAEVMVGAPDCVSYTPTCVITCWSECNGAAICDTSLHVCVY